MKYYIFASGSKGNSTLIIDQNVFILIDVGISRRKLSNELNKLNLDFKNINFILLTHEHGDHIYSVDKFNDIPIYTSFGTYSSKNTHYINPYESFKFLNLKITPIHLSHDAINPLGFIFENENEKLTYITDTGFIDNKNLELINNSTYFIIESNHDINMLENSTYPYKLKLRISSKIGHLSNESCGIYLSKVIGNNSKEIVLSHLSKINNNEEIARFTVESILKINHINIDNIIIKTAKQDQTIEGGSND